MRQRGAGTRRRGYKAIWPDWPDWLAEFEALLAQLYWEHAAVVHISEWMPSASCTWYADRITPAPDGGLPPPPGIRSSTGPRSLDDL